MKYLMILFVLFFTLSSFNVTTSESDDNDILISSNQLQTESLEDGTCRKRTCTYINGELQGCTDWVYYNCHVIVLDPVNIE